MTKRVVSIGIQVACKSVYYVSSKNKKLKLT